MRQLIARIDDDLHARLKERAAKEGRSMNALVTEVLVASVEVPEDPQAELRRRAKKHGIGLTQATGAGRALDRQELREFIASMEGAGTASEFVIRDRERQRG